MVPAFPASTTAPTSMPTGMPRSASTSATPSSRRSPARWKKRGSTPMATRCCSTTSSGSSASTATATASSTTTRPRPSRRATAPSSASSSTATTSSSPTPSWSCPPTRAASKWSTKDTKCDGKDTQLTVRVWDHYNDPGTFHDVVTDFNNIRITNDGMVFVVAFVPKGADIPQPDWAAQLPTLGAADGGAVIATHHDDRHGAAPSTIAGDTTVGTGDTTVDVRRRTERPPARSRPPRRRRRPPQAADARRRSGRRLRYPAAAR